MEGYERISIPETPSPHSDVTEKFRESPIYDEVQIQQTYIPPETNQTGASKFVENNNYWHYGITCPYYYSSHPTYRDLNGLVRSPAVYYDYYKNPSEIKYYFPIKCQIKILCHNICKWAGI
jgi:hypothetical protein